MYHQLAEGLAVGSLPSNHLVTPALSDVAGQGFGLAFKAALVDLDLVVVVIDGLVAAADGVWIDDISEDEVAVEVEEILFVVCHTPIFRKQWA